MKLMLTYLNRNKCGYKHMYIALKWNAHAWVVVEVEFRHTV